MEVGDGDPSGSKDTRAFNVIETTEAPENGHIGIWACPVQNCGRVNNQTEVHLHECM